MITRTVVLSLAGACAMLAQETGNKAPEKSAPWSENDGELLYNGIRLPKVWPPTTMRGSDKPMPVPYLEHPPAVLPINVGRQLFVDDFLVAKTDLTRTYHRAEKYAGNPVLKAETAEEMQPHDDEDDRGVAVGKTNFGPGGVFYDPVAERFQFWYTAGHRGALATAVSGDAVRWERPKLEPAGNNILMPKSPKIRNFGVWLDVEGKDPAQRLKMMTTTEHQLMTSQDGLKWADGGVPGKGGDYCSFFYNPFRGVWEFSIKRESRRGRIRHYAESKEFLKADWSGQVYWMNADALDLPNPEVGDPAQLYSHVAVAYESVMLGEFLIHLGPHNKVCAEGNFPKHTDIKLGFSRDGFHWSRPDREPFIGATRKVGDWDRAYVHAPMGVCFVVGDKLIFPFSAYSGFRPDGTPSMYSGASIGLAMLRRDGFASMDAGEKAGTLETRPVTFDGKYFFVNVDDPNGELRVEVLDETGEVIAPFTAENCVPVKADSTIERVTWKGADDLRALKGKAVKFRFTLTSGQLYSFWVSPDESGASYGFVAAGGPGYKGTVDNVGIKAYPKP